MWPLPGPHAGTAHGKGAHASGECRRARTAGARIGDEKAVGYEFESDFAFEACVQGAVDVTHTASGFFAVPPGASEGQWIGQALFEKA